MQEKRLTPLEVALGVGQDGMTTARKVYAFLELSYGNYPRWSQKHIEQNIFAVEGIDYEVFDMYVFDASGSHPIREYNITARFAKKLVMASQSPKGNEVRNYFEGVEQSAKALVNGELLN